MQLTFDLKQETVQLTYDLIQEQEVVLLTFDLTQEQEVVCLKVEVCLRTRYNSNTNRQGFHALGQTHKLKSVN